MARLLLHRKRYFEDGAVPEIRLWLPARVPGAPVQVSAVLRLAYDDEAGKGDYRHRDGVETPYEFQGLDRLLADFEADLEHFPIGWNHPIGSNAR